MSDELFRTDKSWLNKQYGAPENLEARVALHRVCGNDKGMWYEWLFELLNKHVNGPVKILEIGGGNGNFWVKNWNRIPHNWQIIFTDRSQGMLDSLPEHMKIDGRFSFSLLDAEQSIALSSEDVDVVLANHVLYHVKNPDNLLAEVARVTKKNGLLFASCTGTNHMQKLYDLVHDFNPDFVAYKVIRHFNLQNGKSLLAAHFKSVEVVDTNNTLKVNKEHISLLVEYAFSVDEVKNLLGNAGKEKLHDFFINRLDKTGTLIIPKEEGVFIAKKN